MDFISRCKRGRSTIIIPDGVHFIPNRAFSQDKTVKKVIIGKDVVFIDDMAFSFCTELEEVIFAPGSKCTMLNHGAFMFCTKLKKIYFQSSIKKIGEMCFFNNSSLKKITIPQSVRIIDDYAFGLSGIESINFKSNLLQDNLSIYDFSKRSFVGMKNIKNVTINGIERDVFLCEGHVIEKTGKEKILQDIRIQRGKNILGYFNNAYKDDIWYMCSDMDNKKFTYGKNMRVIFTELKEKLNNNIQETAVNENWTLDKEISMKEYSLISDNCWHNIKVFMEEFGYSESDKLSLREIDKLSRLQRNYSVFESFINKYIIKDDGTRNGVLIDIAKENKNE